MRAVAVGVIAAALIAGYLLKDQCVGSVIRDTVRYDGGQYRHLCYSDVYVLYGARGMREDPIPYIHGDGGLDNEIVGGNATEIGDLEYPPGTGMVVALAALLSRDALAFYVITAVLLAIAGMLALFAIAPMAADPRRLFYFAAAPSLILYAFHNWDLIAVALMCGAFYAFHRRADRTAGALLGIGAATKVFPGLLLPAFVLARYRETRRISAGMVAASAIGFALVNLPFAIANPTGWWFPWKFQSSRFPNYDDVWFFLYRHASAGKRSGFWVEHFTSFVSVASLALFVAGAVWLLLREARRERVRPYATAFGILLLFLLTTKVFSPQYALWVLPFFVLVSVPWYGFAAFAVTEAAVWITVSAFLLSVQFGLGDREFRLSVMEIAVFARAAALAWILWLSRRAEDIVLEEPRPARVHENS